MPYSAITMNSILIVWSNNWQKCVKEKSWIKNAIENYFKVIFRFQKKIKSINPEP